MPEHWRAWIVEHAPTWGQIGLGVLLFVVTFSVSLAVTALVLVRLPADYFCGPQAHTPFGDRHAILRWTWRIGKNFVGVTLVVLGIALSFPGVPGQGILTILLGLMLIDFPGRRKLEQRLVRWPRVRRSVDRLRARFGRPPLILDE